MKKLWKRIPRGWKAALDGAAVLILLLALWAILDYPMPTAKLAFRRAVSGAGFPTRDPELILKLEYDEAEYGRMKTTGRTLGLLAEGNHVLRVSLNNEGLAWMAGDPLWVPTAEGVYYTPLPGWGHGPHGYATKEQFFAARRGFSGEGPCDIRIPAFAVKAPGADASLTLVLGDYREDGETKPGGRFPLVLQEAAGGWFVFRWNSLDIINHLWGDDSYSGGYTDESYWVLNEWLERYDFEDDYRYINDCTTAQLELVTRDADGTVLQEVTWKLP